MVLLVTLRFVLGPMYWVRMPSSSMSRFCSLSLVSMVMVSDRGGGGGGGDTVAVVLLALDAPVAGGSVVGEG